MIEFGVGGERGDEVAFELDVEVGEDLYAHWRWHRSLVSLPHTGHGRARTPVVAPSPQFTSSPGTSSRPGLRDLLDRQRRVEQLLEVAPGRSPVPALSGNAAHAIGSMRRDQTR